MLSLSPDLQIFEFLDGHSETVLEFIFCEVCLSPRRFNSLGITIFKNIQRELIDLRVQILVNFFGIERVSFFSKSCLFCLRVFRVVGGCRKVVLDLKVTLIRKVRFQILWFCTDSVSGRHLLIRHDNHFLLFFFLEEFFQV